MIPTSKELGKQIAALRKKKGLSQIQLAKLSNIPVIAIRRCEQNGAIPLNRYVALANLLKTRLEVGETPMERYQTIDEIVQSRNTPPRTPNPNPTEIRKPRLGGAFDRIRQPT